MDLFILDGSTVKPLGAVPGTIEDLRWTGDAKALIVKAADRGLDGGATNAATRLWWGGDGEPAITSPIPRRRCSSASTPRAGRQSRSVPPTFRLGIRSLGDDGAVAVASEDASERGWYHARLIRIDFSRAGHDPPHLALAASVAVRLAVRQPGRIPRGVVERSRPGRERDPPPRSRRQRSDDRPRRRSAERHVVEWHDEEVLRFAGWSKLGSIYGMVGTDGKVAWSRYEDGVVGTNSFAAGLSTAPDKTGFAAVREAVGAAPEIHFKSSPDADWKP